MTIALSPETAASYHLEGTTMVRQVSARLAVEVGDSRVPDRFVPHVKLDRFLHQATLGVRLHGFDAAGAMTTLGDRIVWQEQGGDRAHFYEKPEDADHPQGAYEFEVLFRNKPASNQLIFDLETEGVTFLYQGELSAQEIADGCTRPENVVGSYALYASRTGNEYQAGKVGHLYRPKATDRLGQWTWCDLAVDQTAGTLTVTVPQLFLDEASYPVTVDPTFGYSTQGASMEYPGANRWYGVLFTSPSDISTATNIHVWAKKNGGTPYVKGTMVLHSTLGIIANGIGGGVEVPDANPADKTDPFGTPPAMSASTEYTIGIVVGDLAGESIGLCYDAGDANQGHYETDNNYASPTNPSTITHNTRKYSIWAEYTATSGTTYSRSATAASGGVAVTVARAAAYGRSTTGNAGSVSVSTGRVGTYARTAAWTGTVAVAVGRVLTRARAVTGMSGAVTIAVSRGMTAGRSVLRNGRVKVSVATSGDFTAVTIAAATVVRLMATNLASTAATACSQVRARLP